MRSNLAVQVRPKISPALTAMLGLGVAALVAAWGTIALSGTKIGVALALAVALGPAAVYAAIVAPLVFPFALFSIVVPFDSIVEFHSFGTLTKIIGIMCGLALVLYIVRTKRYVTPDRSLVAWLAFVVLALCSLSWADDPFSGIIDMTTLASLFLLLTAVSFMPVSVRTLRVVVASIIAGGVLAGIYGAYIFHNGSAYDAAAGGRLVVQLGKETIDPNHFAASLLLPGILVLNGLIESPKAFTRIVLCICGVFIAAGMLLAASRGGLLAACAAYLYMLLRSRRKVVLAAIGVGALAIGVAAFSNIAKRFSEVAATGGAGRLGIWRVGFAAFKTHPLFGAGLGNFSIAYNQVFLGVPAFSSMKIVEGARWGIAPHSNLVLVAVELGVAGLIVFLGAWWFEFRSMRLIPPTSNLYSLRIATEAALIGLFVAGLFLGTVTYKYVWLAFMVAALARNAEICLRRAPQ